MKVFVTDHVLQYADLFVVSQEKPCFKSSSKKAAVEEETDPFDEMMDEAKTEEKKESAKTGLLPESIKATQQAPNVALQARVGNY